MGGWVSESEPLCLSCDYFCRQQSPSPPPLQAKWTKNGTALGRIVSALLHFGSGLSLGPDADGLLNLGDVPAREWREVAEPPPAQRRAMFDVARLLDSGE